MSTVVLPFMRILHQVHTVYALWRLPVVCLSVHMSIAQATEQISFNFTFTVPCIVTLY